MGAPSAFWISTWQQWWCCHTRLSPIVAKQLVTWSLLCQGQLTEFVCRTEEKAHVIGRGFDWESTANSTRCMQHQHAPGLSFHDMHVVNDNVHKAESCPYSFCFLLGACRGGHLCDCQHPAPGSLLPQEGHVGRVRPLLPPVYPPGPAGRHQ